MRTSLKCLIFYLIVGVILLNVYILGQLYFSHDNTHQHQNQHKYSNDFFPVIEKGDALVNQPLSKANNLKNSNEFLVLDWTGHQHIFREQDPIKCDFSHINRDQCVAKFNTLTNDALRFILIERCMRLLTLAVRWTDDQSRLKEADLISYHSIHMPSNNLPKLERSDQRQQYSTVYVLESEVHSSGGHDWHEIDFPMWYNLERSYPEPATYFDLKSYLDKLFAPIRVAFSKKIKSASIVWIISNCNAHNGRQSIVRQLMAHIRIDSFGGCLNNGKSVEAQARAQSNSELYASYKFVISIENSNCEDYVTEKLIDGLSSTAVPIVASRDGKPDYTRFAPNHSYINIYDYKTVKELADYLNYLSNNETAYNEYLWFRQAPANKYATSGMTERSLSENLRLAEEVLGVNATMRRWLLAKEASINKYCKLVQYIHTTYWKLIYKRKKRDRPTPNEVCLPANDIASYFANSSIHNAAAAV
ncbi:unnamed protein product [Rotaria magnacalcarata]|uniref:Fucosyltransferase n=2 Tax=Rotaria magnacalcarata TaxID=392030 RepID=A0A816WB91_9BILA|nr:unnamed protein product [Rotaria magnacalcarata]CAF2148496.1 unnamed protein product [Rotaria magnacalcarata]CAF3785377.1 unnamed protein product [Rotaria magnacalcarata]CAF4144750.1 unnamed protein product [Rotaria magnacalcarata]